MQRSCVKLQHQKRTNDVRQIIVLYEKSQFNSLVWGSLTLAQLSIAVVVYPDRSLTYECLTVVSRKYAPPFVILALVQSVGGGGYMQDAKFSLAITPSLDREMF